VKRQNGRLATALLFSVACLAQNTNSGPKILTWQEIQNQFRAVNPTLLAGQLNVNESQAQEITAYLRPNPDLTLGWDQLNPFSTNPYRPFSQSYIYGSFSYLHERQHKRELRLEAAKLGTQVAQSQQADLERTLMFSLRDAFVRVLQQKAIQALAKDSLDYYDKLITINKARYDAGAIAHVDYQRLELQRVQFETDYVTATVNLRTAKIDLQQLIKDKTPAAEFDVAGAFDFNEPAEGLEQLRTQALDARPDLKAAQHSLEQARANYKLAVADGSTDPTFGFDISHQPNPLNTYIGFSVSIPLRIFDKNQGEKLRTSVDVHRNERLLDAAQLLTLHDVDSAFATLESTLTLLRPYKAVYLREAEEVRDTISFAYQHGGASLLDFLDAQNDYRTTRLAYLNLVGAYMSAANQTNLAVGREVIQ
jgi:cobalt-zinc-cadmium efflux system outer membrane protein